MSARLRVVLVALVVPFTLALPLLWAEPWLSPRRLAAARGEGWWPYAQLLLAASTGVGWIGGVATDRLRGARAAVAVALLLAWMGLTAYVGQRLYVATREISHEAALFAPAVLPHGVIAASAVLLVGVALEARVAATVAACVVLLVQLGNLTATSGFQQLTWGVPWVWDLRSVLLIVLHATLLLAVFAALLRVWLRPVS